MTIRHGTLLLDQSAWDLCLDSAGNWAVAKQPYSIAQDVASAIRTFLGECWYDTNLGLPYWQQILGEYPPLIFVKQKMIEAALTVPDVASADVIFDDFTGRVLSGQVQITDTDHQIASVSF